eukprot:1682976-Alexandrium_andersonii.AAC.1
MPFARARLPRAWVNALRACALAYESAQVCMNAPSPAKPVCWPACPHRLAGPRRAARMQGRRGAMPTR